MLNLLKQCWSVQLLAAMVHRLDLLPQPKPQLLISVAGWTWSSGWYSVATATEGTSHQMGWRPVACQVKSLHSCTDRKNDGMPEWGWRKICLQITQLKFQSPASSVAGWVIKHVSVHGWEVSERPRPCLWAGDLLVGPGACWKSGRDFMNVHAITWPSWSSLLGPVYILFRPAAWHSSNKYGASGSQYLCVQYPSSPEQRASVSVRVWASRCASLVFQVRLLVAGQIAVTQYTY